tara:strand:+ start:2249 stop:3088 length:840 start_codon:yes stop_codon:yes gene_type:complete
MSKNKINVYISSKNYNKPNDFEVSFPTSLIKCDPKTEYIVLNVNGWIMKNEFYNIQSINNKYKIGIDNSEINFELPIGNYNVLELEKILKSQLSAFINIEYDTYLNKYKFTNNVLTNKIIKITSLSANDFIGFDNMVENIISPTEFIYSSNPINMAGDELVVLSIPNIQKSYPVIDDFKTGIMKSSDIIAFLSIDQAPFGLLQYSNQDGGDSFSYRLENTEIDTLRLVCKNQNLEDIQVGNYQLNLQFEIHPKVNEFTILKKIERLVSNIFQFLGKDIE